MRAWARPKGTFLISTYQLGLKSKFLLSLPAVINCLKHGHLHISIFEVLLDELSLAQMGSRPQPRRDTS